MPTPSIVWLAMISLCRYLICFTVDSQCEDIYQFCSILLIWIHIHPVLSNHQCLATGMVCIDAGIIKEFTELGLGLGIMSLE